MVIEADARFIINNNLINKGWRLSPNDPKRNVFFERPKTEEQSKKLKGKRPDYILYQTNTDNPIAIIEAKKPGISLERALEQGTEYAKALDAPLIFAMNGAYCETRFLYNGKNLTLNGEEVRELIREVEALKFINEKSNEVYTVSKIVIESRQELISIFKNLNNVLRGEGLRAGIERFSEFANILFIKLISEVKNLDYWDSLKKVSDSMLISYINNTLMHTCKW
ncbi:type I restriction endonuclease [Tepidimicrobium xylanilyticum]